MRKRPQIGDWRLETALEISWSPWTMACRPIPPRRRTQLAYISIVILLIVAAIASAQQCDNYDENDDDTTANSGGNCLTTPDSPHYDCTDNISTATCQQWAARGECTNDPAYMLQECEKTCGVCGRIPLDVQQQLFDLATEICEDEDMEHCSRLAKETDFCIRDAKMMLRKCRKSCGCCITSTTDFGVEQEENSDEYDDDYEDDVAAAALEAAATRVMVRASLQYMHRIRNSIENANLRKCENMHPLCSVWASLGECRDNEEVQAKCMPACQSCHLLLDMKQQQ